MNDIEKTKQLLFGSLCESCKYCVSALFTACDIHWRKHPLAHKYEKDGMLVAPMEEDGTCELFKHI